MSDNNRNRENRRGGSRNSGGGDGRQRGRSGQRSGRHNRNRNNNRSDGWDRSQQGNSNTGSPNMNNSRRPPGSQYNRSHSPFSTGGGGYQGSSNDGWPTQYSDDRWRSQSPRSRSPVYHNNRNQGPSTNRSASPSVFDMNRNGSDFPGYDSPVPLQRRRRSHSSNERRSWSPVYANRSRSSSWGRDSEYTYNQNQRRYESPGGYSDRSYRSPSPTYNRQRSADSRESPMLYLGYGNGQRRRSQSPRRYTPPRDRSPSLPHWARNQRSVSPRNYRRSPSPARNHHGYQRSPSRRSSWSPVRRDIVRSPPRLDYGRTQRNERLDDQFNNLRLENRHEGSSSRQNGRPRGAPRNQGPRRNARHSSPGIPMHGRSDFFDVKGRGRRIAQRDSFLNLKSIPKKLYLGPKVYRPELDLDRDEVVYPQFNEEFRDNVRQRIDENRAAAFNRQWLRFQLPGNSKGTPEMMGKSMRMVEKENVKQYPGLASNHNWQSDSPPASRSPSPRRSSSPLRNAYSYLPRKICDEDFIGARIINPCLFCNGLHPADNCYKIVDVHERRELLEKTGRCFRCFRRHPVQECPQLVDYQCKYCFDKDSRLGPHHPAICLEAYPEFVKKDKPEDGYDSW